MIQRSSETNVCPRDCAQCQRSECNSRGAYVSGTPDRVPPQRELLSLKDLESIVNFSKSKIYRMVDAGQMPRPMKIGTSTRWRAADIKRWIDGGCKKVR